MSASSKTPTLQKSCRALLVTLTGAMLLLLLGAGCASMADPQGAELPWTGREPWEVTPPLPGGMMN